MTDWSFRLSRYLERNELFIDFPTVQFSISVTNNITESSYNNEGNPTFEPIWFPHWPACKCTISRIFNSFH